MSDLFLAEHLRRIDVSAIYPPFLALYSEALLACHARGADYYAISGYRTYEEQDALYANGRSKTDAGWVTVNEKRIVTKARGGESDHNFGIGIDGSRDKDADRSGLQPDWAMPSYAVLAEEAMRLGLKALYYSTTFPEGPHVGLDVGKFGITNAHLSGVYERQGMAGVWSFLDGFGPWGASNEGSST